MNNSQVCVFHFCVLLFLLRCIPSANGCSNCVMKRHWHNSPPERHSSQWKWRGREESAIGHKDTRCVTTWTSSSGTWTSFKLTKRWPVKGAVCLLVDMCWCWCCCCWCFSELCVCVCECVLLCLFLFVFRWLLFCPCFCLDVCVFVCVCVLNATLTWHFEEFTMALLSDYTCHCGLFSDVTNVHGCK